MEDQKPLIIIYNAIKASDFLQKKPKSYVEVYKTNEKKALVSQKLLKKPKSHVEVYKTNEKSVIKPFL